MNALSQALVFYLGFGIASYPSSDRAKVVEVYGSGLGDELIKNILGIIRETTCIRIDWTNASLDQAGRIIFNEMHARYPELDEVALNAVAWKFTFDWR